MAHHVVVIGDIHLRAGHSRNAARLKALDDIIGEGLALPHLGAWLQLGDVFDAKSSVQDRNDLAPRLQRMAAAAPVVITRGNHDVLGDLEVFSRLEARHPILVFEGPDVQRLALAGPTATLAIGLIPYPSKGGLIAAGTSADETLQAGGDCLRDVLRDFGASLADDRAAGRPVIVAGHLNIGGALTSSGQPSIGRELEVAPAALRLLGDVPIVLGHIHAPQTIGGAYYAGSITANNWGEREAKRFLIVQFDDETLTYEVNSRPIDTPPMVHVDGQLTRDGFVPDPGDYPASWAGVEVRVRYRFAASERNVVDHASVRIPFEGALRLEVEPVAVPDRALRAPEVAAARTLPAKVQAWAGLSGASVTDGVLAKLALLEHGDPTSTLSGVANQVAALERAEKSQVAA